MPAAAACKAPKADPSSDVKDLAQSLCSGATEDKQLAFSTAVAKGGQGAVDAVAALLYAQTQLRCLGKQEFFDIIPPAKSCECLASLIAESCCYRGVVGLAGACERALGVACCYTPCTCGLMMMGKTVQTTRRTAHNRHPADGAARLSCCSGQRQCG